MDSTRAIVDRLERELGRRPERLTSLSGGCIADVYRVAMSSGDDLVVKHDAGDAPTLEIEAAMLERLAAAGAPVPAVIVSAPDLLVMTWVENGGGASAEGEAQLAGIVADLHERSAERYGLDFDTVIGPIGQPNPPSDDWPAFFAEHRLGPTAAMARARGALSPRGAGLVDRIRERIGELIPRPAGPGLVHGDLWAGNVLWRSGRVAALIDPAIYHADPEVELAFIDLMGGVGTAFWQAYGARRPIDPAFWKIRRDLYALYPLLVHAALFGGGYGASVERMASRLVGA